MPLGNPSHCFNHSTLASPKVSISSQLSAPQITAQMAISRISCSRWSHFPLIRGSGNSAKYATRLASLLISSPLVLSPPLYSPSILFHALALIPPAQETIQIQESTVQPPGLENRTMSRLVWSNADKKTGNGAMKKERYEKSNPDVLRPEVEHQGACQNVQGKMSASLKPGLRIAAC